jgi:integrase
LNAFLLEQNEDDRDRIGTKRITVSSSKCVDCRNIQPDNKDVICNFDEIISTPNRDKIGTKSIDITSVGVPTNVKKMCPKNSTRSTISECLSFSMPRLVKGKTWYIYFYAFSPEIGKLKRLRIKITHLSKNKRELEKISQVIINNLSNKLMSGWNPFIDSTSDMNYAQFEDVCLEYSEYIKKLCSGGTMREKTLYGYECMRLTLMTWNNNRKIPITYIYQFKKKLVSEFLDYIYVEKGDSARTRNNYLTWVKVFSNWLVQRDYLKVQPTNGISAIRTQKEKNRTIIPDIQLQTLYDYLEKTNKNYLLACYLLYYTLIRPKEMAKLKLRYFNIKEQTILIPGEISKNRRTSAVTLPQKVIYLMLDLGTFNYPIDYYLFSQDFKPGKEFVSEKRFSDYWVFKIRKDLDFPLEYKFYSLKDSGITTMLHSCDPLTVRDQARHSSIAITNIYAGRSDKANPDLKNFDGAL